MTTAAVLRIAALNRSYGFSCTKGTVLIVKRMVNDSVSLIEMIVCIAFFSISCAIIFQMLTTSVIRSVDSEDLTWASIEAQSMAEAVKKLPAITGFSYGQSGDSEDKISKVVLFDRDRQPVADTDGVYKIILDGTVQRSANGDLLVYDIFVMKRNKEIFKINSTYYFKGGI